MGLLLLALHRVAPPPIRAMPWWHLLRGALYTLSQLDELLNRSARIVRVNHNGKNVGQTEAQREAIGNSCFLDVNRLAFNLGLRPGVTPSHRVEPAGYGLQQHSRVNRLDQVSLSPHFAGQFPFLLSDLT